MNIDYESRRRLLKQFSAKKIIAYNRCFAEISGSSNSGILLSQIMYWSDDKEDKGETEFYKTNEEFCEETVLTLEELKSAKANLKRLGFINVKVKGIPATSYYSVNHNVVLQKLDENSLKTSLKISKNKAQHQQNHQLAGNPPTSLEKKSIELVEKPFTSWGETHQPVGGKSTNYNTEAETTTETTTDIFGDLQQETEKNQALGVLKENAVCELDEISEDLGKKRKHKPYPEDFEKWWAFYPKKDSKKDASKAFLKAKKRIDLEELIAKTKIYVDQYTRKQPTLEFMPHGATWLNGDEWEDVEDQYQLQKLNKPINPDENDLETFISNETGPWKGFLENLYRTLGKPWFISWMKRSADERLITLFKIEDNIAYLHTSTQFMADKLKNDFDHYIRSAIVKNYANVVDYEISKAF